MNPKNLNLYIVDDDDAVRRSLGSLLLAHLDDCSIKTFESGESFLQNANIGGSGVVLLDLQMPVGMSGLEVFQELLNRKSPLVVVFLSAHGDIPVAVNAMRDGAVNWLVKGCSNEVLLSNIETAKAEAAKIAARRRDRNDALKRWSTLTQREKEVAPFIAVGKTSKETAQQLTQRNAESPIDYRTVDNHRAKIFEKLEVANSNELQSFMRENEIDRN